MSPRALALPALAAAAALVVGLSACGSGTTPTTGGPAPTAVAASGGSTNAQVCDTVRQKMSDMGNRSMQQLSDPAALNPAALGQAYRDGAAEIRQEARTADGEVRRAANKVADEFEKLADAFAALSNGSSAPQLGTIADPTALGRELQQACA